MRARSLAVVMSLVAAACGPNGPGTEGSASTTSAESSGGDPTGESEETSTATEETTGDGDGDSWPECVSVNEVFGFEFSMAPLPETTSTRQCTVTSVGMTIFELDCPTQDLPEDLYEFKLAVGIRRPACADRSSS